MRKKNFKGRCEKRKLPKCEEVCRTYDDIQYVYAELLSATKDIKSFRVNVVLDGLKEGKYTSDFVCVKVDGDLMVRECVKAVSYKTNDSKIIGYEQRILVKAWSIRLGNCY